MRSVAEFFVMARRKAGICACADGDLPTASVIIIF